MSEDGIILKIQKSLRPDGLVQVYNEDRSIYATMPLTGKVDAFMCGKQSIYIRGCIENDVLVIKGCAPIQYW